MCFKTSPSGLVFSCLLLSPDTSPAVNFSVSPVPLLNSQAQVRDAQSKEKKYRKNKLPILFWYSLLLSPLTPLSLSLIHSLPCSIFSLFTLLLTTILRDSTVHTDEHPTALSPNLSPTQTQVLSRAPPCCPLWEHNCISAVLSSRVQEMSQLRWNCGTHANSDIRPNPPTFQEGKNLHCLQTFSWSI